MVDLDGQTGFKTSYVPPLGLLDCGLCRDDGYEQLISNGGRFKPAFSERDKKRTMRDEESRQTGFKGTVSRDFLLLVFFMNQFAPSP
jgi:hypothetical protein